MRLLIAVLAILLSLASSVLAGDDPVLNENCPKLGAVKLNAGGTAMFGCACEVADTCYSGQTTNLRWKLMTPPDDLARQMLDHYGLNQWPSYIVCFTPNFTDNANNVKYSLLMHYYQASGREQGFDPADLAPISAFSRVMYGPVMYNPDGTILLVSAAGKSPTTAASAGCPARLALDGRSIQYP